MSAVTHPEIPSTTTERGSGAGRRFGYLLAIAVNLVLLYLINVAPGWQAVSWLTPAAAELVGLANLSLAVGIAANALFVLADPPWFKALGDALVTAVAAILTGRLLQVYPFDFTGWGTDWSWLVTTVLVVALIGMIIAVVVNIVRFLVNLRRH